MRILPPVQEDDRMLAGLSYPLWFVVAPMVLLSARRQEPYVQFHARQAVGLGLASILATMLGGIVLWLFFQILAPGTVTGVIGVAALGAAWVALLFIFCLFLFLGYRASVGEFLRLPYLGQKALDKVMQDLQLSPADLEPSEGPVSPPPASPPALLGPVSPPAELASLRRPPAEPRPARRSTPAGQPRPLDLAGQKDTQKSWEAARLKADPTGVLKRWLTDDDT